MQQNHTIKKFSIELKMAAQKNSYALQRRCVHIIKEEVIQQIDSVLSAHFSTGETVLINRIEIDLGTLKADTLEKEFIQKYITAFSSKIKEIKTSTKTTTAEINFTDENAETIKQLLYFLTTGKMPWANYNIDFNNWQQLALKAMQEKGNEFKTAFTQLLTTNENAAERFINQFTDDFIEAVISLYAPLSKSNIISFMVLLRNTIPANYIAAARTVFYKAILFYITGASSKTAAHYLPGVQAVLKKIPAVLIAAETIQKIIATFTAVFQTNKTTQEVANTAAAKSGLQPMANQHKTAQQITADNTVENDEDAATYITNAGIILLHLYLKTFFTTAGLLNGDDFKDDFCKQKAVHLLQYAGTGQQQLPEYMMTLNKLLCGIPHATHINRFIELTAAEMDMADELLQAVISNWVILGNTSAAALQETFLQRKAKLFFNEAASHWQLQVVRTGLDVLLDKIPWGFSYIKLPWMPDALATEW